MIEQTEALAERGAIARRLRNARQRAKFRGAREFAEHAGVNSNTYYQHENGTRPLSKESASVYAKFLNTSPGSILFGDRLQLPREVRIIGALKKSGRIDEMRNARTEVLPEVVPDSLDGLEVVGPGHPIGFSEGDLVLFRPLDRRAYDPKRLHKTDCVAELDTGELLIGRIYNEDDGRVLLLPMMDDLPIVAASPILHVIKRPACDLCRQPLDRHMIAA